MTNTDDVILPDTDLTCGDCGNPMELSGGASSATIFDFEHLEASHDVYRCPGCTRKLGAVQSNNPGTKGDVIYR